MKQAMKLSLQNSRLMHIQVVLAILFCVWMSVSLHTVYAGSLSCSITTSAACTQTKVLRLSGNSNAHAEQYNKSNSNYDSDVVCCTNVISLGNSCAGTFATVVKMSSTSNAHVQQNNLGSYPDTACLSVPSGGSMTIGYQDTNCSGFDTTLASMSSTSNAHIGDTSAYTRKICGTATGVPQTLSFSISDNTVGFGSLSSVQARFATGDLTGATSDSADAHTMSIASNAAGGYVVTLSGTTLTAGVNTVTAIGSSATASNVGTEQFGLRLNANSGTGAVTSPYNTASWALDTLAFPDAAASGAGDSVTTVFGARYITNIAALTEIGSYSSTLTYTVTATF